MSANENDDGLGGGRKPNSGQWKKGQCGNPGRKRTRKPKKTWKIIEDAFAKEINVRENGVSKRMTVFEAITTQIWLKYQTGNQQAMKVLRKYEAFAKSKPDYEVRPAVNSREAAEEYRRLLYGNEHDKS